MAVTLQQIADKVGVSKMTVSRVLNNKAVGQVSISLAQKILNCAEELNYSANTTAAKLSRLCAENSPPIPKVVMLIPHSDFLQDSFMHSFNTQEIFGGILDAISSLGASVEIVPVSPDNNPLNICWRHINSIPYGSKVIAAGPWFIVALLELSARNCQIALLQSDDFWRNRFAAFNNSWACFTACLHDGTKLLAHELIKQGCSNIALLMPEDVAEEPDNPLINGYEQAMQQAGLPARLLAGPPSILSANYSKKPFDGLLVHMHFNDLPPISENSFQKFFGLPEELPVMFTDSEPANGIFQHAVSVVYPYRQMALDAVKTLLAEEFVPGERRYSGRLCEGKRRI